MIGCWRPYPYKTVGSFKFDKIVEIFRCEDTKDETVITSLSSPPDSAVDFRKTGVKFRAGLLSLDELATLKMSDSDDKKSVEITWIIAITEIYVELLISMKWLQEVMLQRKLSRRVLSGERCLEVPAFAVEMLKSFNWRYYWKWWMVSKQGKKFRNEETLSSSSQCIFEITCWRLCWKTNRWNKNSIDMEFKN